MTDDATPPWLHLLTPLDAGWREKELGKGRDPDPHIEKQLREAGVWPPANDGSDDAQKAPKDRSAPPTP